MVLETMVKRKKNKSIISTDYSTVHGGQACGENTISDLLMASCPLNYKR